jgi:hypothetical protein
MVELYTHYPVDLHGVVLKLLGIGTNLPLPYKLSIHVD